jgi:signal peptidase I
MAIEKQQPNKTLLTRTKTVTKVSYWVLATALVVIALLTLSSALGWPTQIQIFVVQSGSMEPAIRVGSLVLVQPKHEYHIGDVITARVEQTVADESLTVTHRIIDVEEIDGAIAYTTQGDANNTPDADKRPHNSVIGKVTFSIPYLGYPIAYAKTQTGFIILIVIPATIIVYNELATIRKEIKKKINKRKASKKEEETLGLNSKENLNEDIN